MIIDVSTFDMVETVDVYILEYDRDWKCNVYLSKANTKVDVLYKGRLYGTRHTGDCYVSWQMIFYQDYDIAHLFINDSMIEFIKKEVGCLEDIEKYSYISF